MRRACTTPLTPAQDDRGTPKSARARWSETLPRPRRLCPTRLGPVNTIGLVVLSRSRVAANSRALGIDRRALPVRNYGAAPYGPRYFDVKLPVAVDAQTATFVYVNPGQSTHSELRAWGAAHAPLWAALRARAYTVHVGRRPPRPLRPSGWHAWRATAHEARTGRPDRSGRPSMTVRPSPVSRAHSAPAQRRTPGRAVPGIRPRMLPCIRQNRPPTLGGGPVCVWTVPGSCLGSWPGSSYHLTPTEGGCQENRRVGVRPPHSVFTCGCSCVSSCTGRDVTRQPPRRGRERPPRICRWRGSAKGAVSATVSGPVADTHPRLWGRSRPYVSLREDSPAAPADRATTAGAPCGRRSSGIVMDFRL